MKKQLVAATLLVAFSSVSLAQSAFDITFTGTLVSQACTIEVADNAPKIEFTGFEIDDLATATTTDTNLVFTGCGAWQQIFLTATSTAGAGTTDGRVKLAPSSTATGVEIEFTVGNGDVKLGVGGPAKLVGQNASAATTNVTLPLKTKLVADGTALATGTVDGLLTLTASY